MKSSKSGRSPLQSARGVASSVLHRVATEGAYAARTLDAELSQAKLDERDARLATEIVYGSLRTLPVLDARIDQQLSRGRPDPYVLATLRAATYQALYLSRVPDHAIVQESVSLVRAKRGEGMSRLTNAVLRRIVEGRPRPGAAGAPDAEPREDHHERLYVPGWVEQCLTKGLGAERTQAFLSLSGGVPPLALRVRAALQQPSAREELLGALRAAAPNATVEPSGPASDSLVAWGVGDPRKLPGFVDGKFVVQDEGANLVGRLVGARPGERVLDACAGRGGKTLQLLEAVGPTGQVTAVDIHARKLEQLTEEVRRLAVGGTLLTETIDFSVGDGGLEGGFDRVLVDAPCSGLGTIRRRPEILLRLQPRDPGRLADLQLGILRRALRLVRPGGTLVFAVCSASAEEGAGVLERLEAKTSGIRRLADSVEGVPVSADNDGVFRIGPWLGVGGSLPDVYQVVRWEVLDTVDGGV
ncbi:MAG: transcription antitermination factor NusB [Myxococcales bacterium]